MKELCRVQSSMKHCVGEVTVLQWEHGDPFPELGASVGVDTETEKITDTCLAPPLVVLGVFDAAHMTCYVVYWQDAPEFMQELCQREVEQRYFNLGFDEQVLDNEDPDKSLMYAIDQDLVHDMQIRIHLHEIATIGFIRYNMHNLAGCAENFLNCYLDKGDGTDESARLSFHRYNADGTPYVITDEQALYLPFDCISTWALGEAVPHQATEEIHTKGMVVLAHISSNGLRVDPVVFDGLERKLYAARDKYRQELVGYGFPDPYRDDQKEAQEVKDAFFEHYTALLNMGNLTDDMDKLPGKNGMRAMIIVLSQVLELGDTFAAKLKEAAHQTTGLRKAQDSVYAVLSEKYEIASIDKATKVIVMPAFVGTLMEVIRGQLGTHTYNFAEASEQAQAYIDAHPVWVAATAQMGPRKFFQEHVQDVLRAHPDLKLETTEKSGEIKLTLKDMWRLEDCGIQDGFLTAYTNYNHCCKMLSTYMNRDMIRSDARVRTRYVNLLRTGRTSSTSPNIQNLPSRDKVYPIKNIYSAEPGMVLCATDYGFAELIGLSESCIQRFGKSALGDIINAGIDPHRWFAGVREKLIDSSTEFTKYPDKVAEMAEFLAANISKKSRQDSKAANFGFGGGMEFSKFWVTCREQGMKLSLEDAKQMRLDWLSAFPEMNEHMNPQPIKDTAVITKTFGFKPEEDELDEDDDEQDGKPKRLYKATLVNGMVRNRCSYCAALNFQFQGLIACGVKNAMWKLAMLGLMPRMVNMIHDEILYNLYPEELDTVIPQVEAAMIAGMREVTPHVKVGVETSCCTHWDKGAKEFVKLAKDDNGAYIIDDPEEVKRIYAEMGAGQAH